jgi:hypothetical protein
MLDAVIESHLEGKIKKPRERLEDYFKKFDKCVKNRKLKFDP